MHGPDSIPILAVMLKNIYVAISSRVFEGLASDNILHFCLNAVYAQVGGGQDTSRLINHSLALYMIGISISPFVAGLFNSFTVSIFMALGLFSFCLVYMQLALPMASQREPQPNLQSPESGEDEVGNGISSTIPAAGWLHIIVSPFQLLYLEPGNLLVGLSLFAYNLVQSYMFTCLLIFSSTQFGFIAKENGFIISIAHCTAALYIFTTIGTTSALFRCFHINRENYISTTKKRRDLILACVSLMILTISLGMLRSATKSWHLYFLTVFLSLGLPASSFLKAFFARGFPDEKKAMSLASLAVMEILGSVGSPLIFGILQFYLQATAGIFYIASLIIASSLVMLVIGAYLKR